MTIHTAQVFINGQSQAIRLPKEFRLDVDEVYISKQGENLIISPKKTNWDDFFDAPSAFGDDFLREREDMIPQERQF